MPPDRTAGNPIVDMRACDPLRLQLVRLGGAQVGRMLQHGVRDAARRGQMRWRNGPRRWRRPAGRRRPRAGRDRGRHRWCPVADVEHVVGDVGVADLVPAQPVAVPFDVDHPRRHDMEPGRDTVAVVGGGQDERLTHLEIPEQLGGELLPRRVEVRVRVVQPVRRQRARRPDEIRGHRRRSADEFKSRQAQAVSVRSRPAPTSSGCSTRPATPTTVTGRSSNGATASRPFDR